MKGLPFLSCSGRKGRAGGHVGGDTDGDARVQVLCNRRVRYRLKSTNRRKQLGAAGGSGTMLGTGIVA